MTYIRGKCPECLCVYDLYDMDCCGRRLHIFEQSRFEGPEVAPSNRPMEVDLNAYLTLWQRIKLAWAILFGGKRVPTVKPMKWMK